MLNIKLDVLGDKIPDVQGCYNNKKENFEYDSVCNIYFEDKCYKWHRKSTGPSVKKYNFEGDLNDIPSIEFMKKNGYNKLSVSIEMNIDEVNDGKRIIGWYDNDGLSKIISENKFFNYKNVRD